jgi:hypothetical protein
MLVITAIESFAGVKKCMIDFSFSVHAGDSI